MSQDNQTSPIAVVLQITLFEDGNLSFTAQGGNITVWMGMLARAGHLICNPPETKKEAPKIIPAGVIPKGTH